MKHGGVTEEVRPLTSDFEVLRDWAGEVHLPTYDGATAPKASTPR